MNKKTKDVELALDAWARFERAIDVVAKSPPQHRKAKRKARKSPAKRKPVKKSD